MTVEAYQQFLEYLGTIDVLEGIDDFAPDWKPLTKEEYHDRYIEKIKAGIPAGKITQEMYDFWVDECSHNLSSEDNLIAFKAHTTIIIKKNPELAGIRNKTISAMEDALNRGEHEVTIEHNNGVKGTIYF